MMTRGEQLVENMHNHATQSPVAPLLAKCPNMEYCVETIEFLLIPTLPKCPLSSSNQPASPPLPRFRAPRPCVLGDINRTE